MEDIHSSTHARPASSAGGHRRTSSSHSQRKPWQSRGQLHRSSTSRSRPEPEEIEPISRQNTHSSSRSKRQAKWWKIRLFKGMIEDVRRRAPFYLSDWKDAWDYRVVPATLYMYFANILPALAFSLDMFVKTDNSFGVNEVLLASVLGCVVFSVLAAQPLVIVGVTGQVLLTPGTLPFVPQFCHNAGLLFALYSTFNLQTLY